MSSSGHFAETLGILSFSCFHHLDLLFRQPIQPIPATAGLPEDMESWGVPAAYARMDITKVTTANGRSAR